MFFLEDERIPLKDQQLTFDPNEVQGIICNLFFQHNTPDDLPNLRHVQLTSTGMDRVPVKVLQQRDIRVYNAGSTYATPMAEWAVGKILELYKCSRFFANNQQSHTWEKHRGVRELSGEKAALIGFGNVGRGIAQRLKPFGVNICAVDVVEDTSGLSDRWYHISELKAALQEADIVVLTLPLLDTTYHTINADMLSAMKNDAVLVNVARGKLIDERALVSHLQAGKLWGAALDVFEEEPLSTQSLLWEFEHVILTPHNSFVGSGNQTRLFDLILRNLEMEKYEDRD